MTLTMAISRRMRASEFKEKEKRGTGVGECGLVLSVTVASSHM